MLFCVGFTKVTIHLIYTLLFYMKNTPGVSLAAGGSAPIERFQIANIISNLRGGRGALMIKTNFEIKINNHFIINLFNFPCDSTVILP